MHGVLRTRVGYCGGTKTKPSYYSLGDHTEAISIDYDPGLTSYEDMLGYFWDGHRCERNNHSRQYMNAVFIRNDTQQEVASASLAQRAESLGIPASKVATEILPIGDFTYAEGYHHKYYLTRYPDVREFLDRTYPLGKALADSTAATRLNAYLGSGMERDWNTFLAELSSYGLPDAMADAMRKMAESQLEA